MIIALIQVSASTYSQNTKLSLSGQKLTIEQVLAKIEDQTDFSFFYNSKEVDLSKLVNVDIKDQRVEDVLDFLMKGTGMTYTINNKLIVIHKSQDTTFTAINSQQTKSVSGNVTDSSGQALPGVTVIVKGTTQGTITNADGNYSLSNVPGNAVLVFSFVGMKTQELEVSGKTTITITMEEETVGIDEVVAIGYGTVKKKDLTGSVSQISPNAYKAQPVQGIPEMLRGNVSGVIVKTNGDGSTKIRIRGSNSLNGNNNPLYIVDGVPMGSYSPNDVESIEILKDASATAIYGSRGANGVVLITTKRGKMGNPAVEVSANTSFATYPKFYDLLNGAEFADFYNSYFGRSINFDKSINTDWQRETTQTGIRQNYQANVSGGTEKMKFYVGGNYINNTALIKNQSDKTYRLRSNFDFKLGSKFHRTCRLVCCARSFTWIRHNS